MPKMAREQVSLAQGFQFYLYFLFIFFIFWATRVSILRKICLYTYTHTCDFVEMVYDLPLLPSNTASETYLLKSGAV